MANIKGISPSPSSIRRFYAAILFACTVLVLATSSGPIGGMEAKSSGDPFTVIGKCAQFEDCNKACTERGFAYGICEWLGPGANSCCCYKK